MTACAEGETDFYFVRASTDLSNWVYLMQSFGGKLYIAYMFNIDS